MEQSAQIRTTTVTRKSLKCEARSDRVIALLHRMYPHKTAEYVEADTGIRAATVRQWIARESAPSFRAFCKLISAYGPDVLCAALDNPPAWLDAAAREETQRKLDAQIAALQARRAAL